MADSKVEERKRARTTSGASLGVGDKIPGDVCLDFGFPPEKVNLAKRVAGKKVILMGLPGAFTPT